MARNGLGAIRPVTNQRLKGAQAKWFGRQEQSSRKSVAMMLEHVPKRLIGFFDQNMLQLFDFERFLFYQMILSGRKGL
jgi:hypothetical protein